MLCTFLESIPDGSILELLATTSFLPTYTPSQKDGWPINRQGHWRLFPKRVQGTICARDIFIFTWGESTLPGQTGQHIVGSFIGWWQRTGGQLSISHNTPPSWHIHFVHSSNNHVSPSAWYCPSLAWHLVGSPGTNGLLPSEMFQINY